MKLKDLLTKETHDKWGDMDVANDVTDELWPAWCGETLTEVGAKDFAPVLELEAEIAPVWGYPGIVLLIDKDANWEEEWDEAGNLFNAIAGYCDEDQYELWFKEDLK